MTENYTKDKKQLIGLLAQEDDNDAQVTILRGGIFDFAVGLFAYGKLHAADDALNCLPKSGTVCKLVFALKAMLPLPNDLDPLKDPQAVRSWLEKNGDELEWNESIGKYERIKW